MIDFHLHLFTRTYFETLAALSPQPGSVEERLQRVAAKVGLELPAPDLRAHVARWLAEFDRHEVQRAAAFASVPEEIPLLAQARELSGGRLVPFALANPLQAGCAQRVEGLIASQGFAGVLLFPALHHYRLGGSECAELFTVLERRRATAFVHCGSLVVKLRDLLGIPRSADLAFANPLDLIPAANAHPNARFVIPHFGAGLFRETLLAGTQCENVYVDSSSSNSWVSSEPSGIGLKDVFARALAVFGPKRILFGTDSSTFPKGWQRARYDEQRALLAELKLPTADQEAIFGGNAERLLAG